MTSCSIQLPSFVTWKYLVAVQSGYLLLGMPLGVILFYTPKSSKIRTLFGIFLAVATASLVSIITSRNQSHETHWMGPFLAATFGFSTFFKSISVGFSQHPSGIDNDLKTFILWFVALPEPQIAKGKMKCLTLQETVYRFKLFAWKIFGLACLVSFFRSFSLYPSSFIGGGSLIDGFVHTWYLYLFASFCLDFSNLSYSTCFQYSSEVGFKNPLLESRTLQECWGIRWDCPVQVMLKRSVYVPIRRAGGGREIAVLATFLASGLLHEYTFSIHNSDHYEPGEVTLFFLLMGALILFEAFFLNAICPEQLKELAKKTPSPVFSSIILLLVVALPFEPLFIRSFLESGMFSASADMFPHVFCEAR